ncbi:CoA pyrophosphatase [Vibrio rotiferianus]|uniref:CoA pyrophosphatase n=1 Tax=Vibrio rotiferianus TaxID=190895 RepID=UPI001110ABE1|nr:CoA pyrophosphatase [Vibrio rotiferianus]TMX41363.1 CoA pyrophosphatase [Vibrio rotiferianus]TMX46794.1 CoA pyrophosphatase [Vibrio rotiferianus]TMX68249.1 CoA pyrophosphatase [Vibrio rotiferianus]
MVINKSTLLQNFQLQLPTGYHKESLVRLAHLKNAELREAAVLIGFVEREQDLQVIFTKRAMHLRHHPGQISFPGGKYEPEDGQLVNTALREVEEEIGIEPSHIRVFGQLPTLPTISQFNVTPFLAFVSPEYTTRIDPNEVDEVFEVPANHILNPSKLFSNQFKLKNTSHRVFAIPFQQHFIWGMTAQIIESMQKHITSN